MSDEIKKIREAYGIPDGADIIEEIDKRLERMESILENYRNIADVPVTCMKCKHSWLPYIAIKTKN